MPIANNIINILFIRLHVGMFDKENRGTVSFQDFGALWKYVTDWQTCFRSFDSDNSGNIDRNELRTALTSFGYRLSDNLIGTLVRKFDRFGQGTILFDDFIQCCIILYVSIAIRMDLTSLGWNRLIIIVNVYRSNADDDLLVPCHGPRYGRRNHNSLRAVPVDGLQPQDLNEMLLIHCPIGV